MPPITWFRRERKEGRRERYRDATRSSSSPLVDPPFDHRPISSLPEDLPKSQHTLGKDQKQRIEGKPNPFVFRVDFPFIPLRSFAHRPFVPQLLCLRFSIVSPFPVERMVLDQGSDTLLSIEQKAQNIQREIDHHQTTISPLNKTPLSSPFLDQPSFPHLLLNHHHLHSLY